MNTTKQKLLKRLRIIEGQMRGLQDMLEKDVYCVDIITQTSAVKRALSSVEDALMENHLNTCVIKQVKEGNQKTAVDEILKVYYLKK